VNYRLLGRTGVWVSQMCLGTMTFGGGEHPIWGQFGGLRPADADRLVGTALDAGVNFVDTANVYGGGEAEEILGQSLGKRRQDVVLATKVHAATGAGPNDQGLSRLHVMQALEDSLRRLRTDHIDLYQLHNFDHVTPMEETLRALDDAVRQGKVRYIGCANLAAWQASQALGISARHELSRFVSAQVNYSLLARDVEREIVPMAHAHGLALTVWGPLAGGFLTGKIDRNTPPARGRRAGGADFPPVDRDRAYDVVDVARAVAARHEATVPQVALAWLLAQPGVTSVIIGARTLEQLTGNLAASSLQLTGPDHAELGEVSKLPRAYPNWIQEMFAPQRIPSPAVSVAGDHAR
jgi:aryl-alcohol dehydrogenase-like predicted oxidoreductase